MKKWVLCLLCTITLGLGIVGIAGLASAEPAPGAPALNPVDQQFLASLAMPEPALMAPPNPCGSDFCTSTQQQQCMQHCWSTVWCDGILSCNTTSCTSTCVCAGRCY